MSVTTRACSWSVSHDPHIWYGGIGGIPGPVSLTTYICPGVEETL